LHNRFEAGGGFWAIVQFRSETAIRQGNPQAASLPVENAWPSAGNLRKQPAICCTVGGLVEFAVDFDKITVSHSGEPDFVRQQPEPFGSWQGLGNKRGEHMVKAASAT
jgi:hypothetical protein